MDNLWIVEVLKIALTVVSFLVAAFAIIQNQERSRRELATTLIYNWANHLDWPTSRAIGLLADLKKSVVVSIDNREEAEFQVELYDAILSVLTVEFLQRDLPAKPKPEDTIFRISAEQSAFIRFLWVRWLNRLEGTLTAWQQGAASEEIMRSEFKPLVEGRKAELKALEDVRDGLPVIASFFDEHLSKKKLQRRKNWVFKALLPPLHSLL
ncbi:hypothetical protein GMES_4400 [Paraglaciecola mesophila KMM 241]|uniref:DUF4760 domain-containing protein n=1 Tax=Paraglaciecola mesophila KMM 241 TaxID=1128912 RepID=K6YRP7_9ALTE|nr:hypothetical protein [Paraglaciecola mesophila]GAC26666.1 hypothetical protein GMES_4400 [Paraglaciecola mesophila KMM 241]